MSERRPCVVKTVETQRVQGESYAQPVTVEKEAFFHRFGDDTTYANDLLVPFTVAIVEMKETGQIRSVEPKLVRFTGP